MKVWRRFRSSSSLAAGFFIQSSVFSKKTKSLHPTTHVRPCFHRRHKGRNILISTFIVGADGFQGLSKGFHYSMLLRNELQILKMLTETHLRIPFSLVNRCFPHIFCRENAQELRRLPVWFLQNHRRLPVRKIAALGSLKRVTGRIFKISTWFQRSKLKLSDWFFLSTRKQKNMYLLIIISL